MHCSSNAMFVRGVTSGPDRVRQRVQARPGDVGLPSVQSRDRAGDDLEQCGGRGSACYIATRTRRSRIIPRVRRSTRVPARPRFFTRNCAPDRSCTLLRHRRTHVRLPAPPQFSSVIARTCESAIHFVPSLCPNAAGSAAGFSHAGSSLSPTYKLTAATGRESCPNFSHHSRRRPSQGCRHSGGLVTASSNETVRTDHGSLGWSFTKALTLPEVLPENLSR
jgi:hypothetical protein